MTGQDLRNCVLQLAVQGKLVGQLPVEGTGFDLLKRIKKEREQAVKNGAIKKRKSLPEITEDEIPFDIPENWVWVRLYDLADACQTPFADGPFGSNLKSEHYTTKQEVRIIQLSNIGENGWKDSNVKYTTFEHLKTIERSEVCPGDIVIAKMMPAGRAIIVPEGEYKYVLSSDAVKFVPSPYLNKTYLYYIINSPFFRGQVYSEVHGITRVRTSLQKLQNYLIPLPPLSEQKRIVAKIEALLPIIDRFEDEQNRLEEIVERFPVDLQKSVLQQAIQGKLVEQRPEEGTGEELYQEIQREKQRLVKEGKIKKEKELPEIKDDEIPFDVPESWKWVRLGEVFLVGTGMTPLKGERNFYQNGNIPWVTSSLTSNRYINSVETYITDYALENTTLTLYPPHTLIVAMYGQGKTRGQISELLISATVNQACASLQNIVYYPSFTTFVYFFFQYNYELIRKKAEGTSQPNLNLQKIKETIIPLPPLAEQKRIVAKIEALLSHCERLKEV